MIGITTTLLLVITGRGLILDLLNWIATRVDGNDVTCVCCFVESIVPLYFELAHEIFVAVLDKIVVSIDAIDLDWFIGRIHFLKVFKHFTIKYLHNLVLVVLLQVVGPNHLIDDLLQRISEHGGSINRSMRVICCIVCISTSLVHTRTIYHFKYQSNLRL